MKKHLVLLSAFVFVLTLGFLTPQFAQDPPNSPPKLEQARHALAIGFLRTINTMEVVDFTTYGSFASWETLVAHQSENLRKWIARFNPEITGQSLPDLPEVLPGWNLRLNVHIDGKGYDVMFEDTTDKEHHYAALSDERGIIRESYPLR